MASLRLLSVGRADDGVTLIDHIRDLTDAEVSRFEAANEHLNDFSRTRDLLGLVEDNLAVVERQFDLFLSETLAQPRGPLDEGNVERRGLQVAAINYLCAVRMYLDHRHTHLKRRYGGTSDILEAFTAARKHEHASCAEYAFVYELRNFVQHCGMPLQAIGGAVSATEDGPVSTGIIGCKREDLLKLFQDWKHSEAFIRSQQLEFPVLPLFKTMLECLRRVEAATVNAIMPSLWLDAKTVVQLIAEGCSDRSIGLVGTLENKSTPSGNYLLTFRRFPESLLRWLGLVEPTEGPPEFVVRFDRLKLQSPPDVTPG